MNRAPIRDASFGRIFNSVSRCIMPFQRMDLKRLFLSLIFHGTAGFILSTSLLFLSWPARADFSIIKKGIVDFNLEQRQKSLTDGAYRGEEGILMIAPEVGRSFGLTVRLDQDYLEAGKEFKRAENFNKDALRAMKSRKRERFPDEHIQSIAESVLLHKRALESARKRLVSYRSGLSKETDQRLDYDICYTMLEKLLKRSLAMASNNLREALGYFKNICQGLDIYTSPLKSGNIRFVNYVFGEFMKKAADDDKKRFDLDRQRGIRRKNYEWKRAIEGSGARYVSILKPLLEEHGKNGYSVDPLLFFALMRQESSFNPRCVSPAGAVGLAQIMPRTAKDLGMVNIFIPSYFEEAKTFRGRERSLRRQAQALIQELGEDNKLEMARRARDLMQASLDCRGKRKKLYARYKRELLRKGRDDRLNPELSIEYGYKYFATMIKSHGGDISLALAAYNAGPHRVRRFNGIPPFDETVAFRNKVIGFYRDYQRKLKQ